MRQVGLLGDVAADVAEDHAFLDLLQRLLQPGHVGRVGAEQVEGDPLRALRPDAGEPAELVDQVLDRALVHRLHAGQAEPAQATGETAHPVGGELLRAAARVAHGGDDQVGQRLGVLGVDRLRVDRRATSARRSRRPPRSPARRRRVPVVSALASSSCAVMSCSCIFWACCRICCMSGTPPGCTPAPLIGVVSQRSRVARCGMVSAVRRPCARRVAACSSLAGCGSATSGSATAPAVRRLDRRPRRAPPRSRGPAAPRSRTSDGRHRRPSAAPRPVSGVVVLDPGHNGGNAANPAAINRQVPAGRGRTQAVQHHRDRDRRGLPGARVHLGGFPAGPRRSRRARGQGAC